MFSFIKAAQSFWDLKHLFASARMLLGTLMAEHDGKCMQMAKVPHHYKEVTMLALVQQLGHAIDISE